MSKIIIQLIIILILLIGLIVSIVNVKKKKDFKSLVICLILGTINVLVFYFFKDNFTLSNIFDEIIKFGKEILNKVTRN